MTCSISALATINKGPRAKYGLCVLTSIPIPLAFEHHRAQDYFLGDWALFGKGQR